jgi:hypothetical protein
MGPDPSNVFRSGDHVAMLILVFLAVAAVIGIFVIMAIELVRFTILLAVPIALIWGISRFVKIPIAWRRFFNGIQNETYDRVTATLAGLEDLEPEYKILSVKYEGSASYSEWCEADPDKREMEMVYVRKTPETSGQNSGTTRPKDGDRSISS